MWKLNDLLKFSKENLIQINGKWVACRPENFKCKYCNIFKRLIFAWQVILGKAETFTWPEGQ